MKKLFSFAFLLFGFASCLWASTQTPKDNEGFTIPTIAWTGADTCTIMDSTGTSAVLCNSGASIVYGVIIASDAVSNYAIFRDSGTANTTSSSMTVVFVQGNGTTQVTPATVMQLFPVPLKFNNGISVNLNASPTAGKGMWTILYRKKTALE